MWSVGRGALLALAIGVIIAVTLLRPQSAPGGVYRFVDHHDLPRAWLSVQGTTKRIIARHQATFTLPRLPPQAVLSFSVGLKPSDGERLVRFRIELEQKGRTKEIYQREVSTSGWVDERINLPEGDLSGAQLSFTRQNLRGKPLGNEGAFGDPVLLWEARDDRPSVILISLDTLRADRVGLYGYGAARTPTLDALGQGGVWYRHAYSPSTWTLPSHASLLWSGFLELVPLGPAPHVPAPLMEALRSAGYLTAGFTGGGWMSNNLGFHSGFDTFYSYTSPPHPETCPPNRFDGADVFAQASAWLRDRGQAPFFMFVHTYEPHDRCPFLKKVSGQLIVWDELSPARNAELQAYYDDLIARSDRLLGTFLHELETLGLSENTLVVVTSDHGEAFSEHGERGHGTANQPFEEIGRVPLIFHGSRELASRGPVDDPVSIIDVAPTILSLLGVPRPPSMVGGMLPGLGSSEPPRPVYVFSESAIAVRSGSLKLIRSKGGKVPDQLYDLSVDPGERKNLASARPKELGELGRLADAFIDRGRTVSETPPLPEVDPQTRERLRALGYGE